MHEPVATFVTHDGSPGTGNRTRDGNYVYQWDGLNRLRVVRQRQTPTNVIARYTYDAHPAILGGRRVQKTVTNRGSLNGTTRFFYDRDRCIEERVVTAEGERVSRQYIFGEGPDEVHAMDLDTSGDGDPDNLFFYLRDHNNNITQLIQANGGSAFELVTYNWRGAPSVLSPTAFTPIGSNNWINPYLFTGQRYDVETGLYYYKARYYDPVFGVFLSRDPLGAWQDGDNLGNGMAYAVQNPWNRIDFEGLQSGKQKEKSWFVTLLEFFSLTPKGGTTQKKICLGRFPYAPVTPVKDYFPTNATFVPPGEYARVSVTNLAPGHVVYTSGAGPCIAVYVIVGTDIIVAHLSATANVAATLDAACPADLGTNPEIYIGGGNADAASGQTLGDVADYFTGRDAKISGQADLSGMGVMVNKGGTTSLVTRPGIDR